MMRLWRVRETGGAFGLAEAPAPVPAPGEALVQVAAVGLNFADLLMREGKYQQRPPLPYTPGMEMAGTVTALGPGTAGPAPGTRVMAYLGHGALAEQVAVPADRLLPLPDAMPFAHAAAFPVAYGTSHLALDHKARLQPGETLIVSGAAGGVGLTAVEIGARMGARVIALARGAEKLAIARAAGAEEALDSDRPDLKAALRAIGADVVYDAVGGAAGEAALSALRPEGRFLAIGFASGEVPQVRLNHLLVKNVSVIGFWWGGYVTFAPALLDDSLRHLLALYAAGGLRPHVSHEIPFGQLPEALDLLRDRRSTGKVVVVIPPEARSAR
jgi:NADPH2:quinone reductase